MEKYFKVGEIVLLFPLYHEDWGDYVSEISAHIKCVLSYGDALIAEAIEQSDFEALITWNKKHFEGKIEVKVLTPKNTDIKNMKEIKCAESCGFENEGLPSPYPPE
jgi:hypothetical protein